MPLADTAQTARAAAIRATILEQIAQVGAQQERKLLPLRDDLALLESGLDSLCIAVLVASLDDQLEIDPFSGDDDVPFPVTIGDFIQLYIDAAG